MNDYYHHEIITKWIPFHMCLLLRNYTIIVIIIFNILHKWLIAFYEIICCKLNLFQCKNSIIVLIIEACCYLSILG